MVSHRRTEVFQQMHDSTRIMYRAAHNLTVALSLQSCETQVYDSTICSHDNITTTVYTHYQQCSENE